MPRALTATGFLAEALVLGDELVDVAPDRLLGGVAEQPLGGGVPRGDDRVAESTVTIADGLFSTSDW